jgi:uncharacterized membrane protein YeaQ/YmgE (transglycosylase-associated protein family)
MEFFVYLIVGAIFGAITQAIGTNKGHDNCFWWGFFLGFIGIIVVALKKDKSLR